MSLSWILTVLNILYHDLLFLGDISKSFFTTPKCTSVGAIINWQTELTEKAISSLVKVRYCSDPTILLYILGSDNIVPYEASN